MKNSSIQGENYNEKFIDVSEGYLDLTDLDFIKSSRLKKAHKTRRKIEEHLERKKFKNFYNDIKDIDWNLED